ncbi:MAG: sigma-54 dependent transcriptional regulator, partial [Planctomycetota bacterium]|nr:sigma-54 dependent transcriptional regulator [Planctomycetota bacterium]
MDILIIDDEVAICEALQELLEGEGFSCAYTTKPREGVARAGDVSVLLLDLKLPGVEGLELLEEIHATYPRLPIIMVTAHGTIRTAVEAMKRGASDFITKPADSDELLAAIDKGLRAAETEEDVSTLYYDLPEEIILRDPGSLALLDELRKVAATDLAVLLNGETGVGKEVFARLVHEGSARAQKPLVKINCAAIPETLFESEIFGHEKGAFTGASVAKPGRAELADGGTLFLDEIGELPAGPQAKLLQFLQDHTFERVGGLRTLKSDVRLVTATNRDLEEDVREGKFRQDLFFRINGHVVTIPPLRERPDDSAALAEHFLARFAARSGRKLRFAPGALDAVRAHVWPGNVRELEHVVEKACALCPDAEITLDLAGGARPAGGSLREQKQELEKVRI